jgi:hypothetical protein
MLALGIKVAETASGNNPTKNDRTTERPNKPKKDKENENETNSMPCKCRRKSKRIGLPRSNTGSPIRTPQMNNRVTGPNYQHQPNQQRKDNLLGKHIDHTPTQPFMTNTTNPLLGNSNMASTRTRPIPTNTFTNSQPRLDLHIVRFTQISHDARFIEDRVRSPHAALEIEFQFLHGLLVWYEF